MKIIPYLVLWFLILPRASAVDFEKDVKPVLERRCAKCHAYGERKGGLSMETRESLLKGGEDGKVVEAGKTTAACFSICSWKRTRPIACRKRRTRCRTTKSPGSKLG